MERGWWLMEKEVTREPYMYGGDAPMKGWRLQRKGDKKSKWGYPQRRNGRWRWLHGEKNDDVMLMRVVFFYQLHLRPLANLMFSCEIDALLRRRP
jgi:hypothetical protein